MGRTLREPSTPGGGWWDSLPAAAAMFGALLPALAGLVHRESFFFRDLAGQFFPDRLLALAALRQGQTAYWNPYTHEGEPLPLLPLGYPVDLLQLLAPSEWGLSLILALHLPLAAFAFYALAKALRICPLAAAGGASIYALGGFALSCLNLYVHLQALAWSPLVVRGLLKAASGDRRDAARGAVPLGLALTTMGVEFVGQVLVIAVCLAAPRRLRSAVRLALALVLGTGLAAYVLFPVSAQVADSARGAGFPTEVVLSHSIHPITLIQSLVAGFYAEPHRFTETFWGQNFFPRGFPYFLSLYLGAASLALALIGVATRPRLGWTLAVLGGLGLIAALGRYAGLGPAVDAFPVLRGLRFPSKAFFTVHLVVALLASLSLDALAVGSNRCWRHLSRLGLLFFALLTVLPGAVHAHAGMRLFLLGGFFPADMPWSDREAAAAYVVRDAATGGFVVLAIAAVALLAARGHVASRTGAALVAALVAGDLLRAGAGLNPTVPSAFYRLSTSAEQMAAKIRESGKRLFVVDPGYSPAYFAARATRGRKHERWTFAVLQESFAPEFNLSPRLRTAMSIDRTMLVPEDRILRPQDAAPSALPRLLPRLREGAVSYVVSVEPIEHPDLALVAENRSEEIAPLVTRLYELRGAAPRIEILGLGRVVSSAEAMDRIKVAVDAASDATLVIRDAHAPGWKVWVDGEAAGLSLHESRYRAVAVPRGWHEVEFTYTPPGLRLGVALSLVSLSVLAVLLGVRHRQPTLEV